MFKKEVKYITVTTPDGALYGGNQNLFPGKILHNFGCGLIAAADVSLCLSSEQREISLDEYIKYVEKIRRNFLIFPKMGMNGWSLAFGLNCVFRKEKLPYVAHWKMMPVGKRSKRKMEGMLKRGIPVILSAGPNFPNPFGKEKITLYTKITDKHYKKSGSMNKHFVTVTAMGEDAMMRVSSWGKCYYISYDEWIAYAKESSMPFFSNYLYIRKKKRS